MNNQIKSNVNISAEIKLPADKLDLFLKDLNELEEAEKEKFGEIYVQNIYSEEITNSYYDLQTRLKTREKTLDKYYEFLDNAKTIEEQLSVSEYISNLTSEIENIKGNLKRYNELTNYSRVYINIYQKQEIDGNKREIVWSALSFDDVGWLIKSGFFNTLNAIVNIFEYIIIGIVGGSPVILPLGIAVFFVVRNVKKNKKSNKIKIENSAINQENNNTENNIDTK